MKKLLLAALAATTVACTSVESATVPSNEIAADGTPLAVVQGTSVGFSILFNLVNFVQSDLDTVVNKLLVSEAKAMGGTKVQLLDAQTTPRHGIFAVFGVTGLNIINFPIAQARGVVLR